MEEEEEEAAAAACLLEAWTLDLPAEPASFCLEVDGTIGLPLARTGARPRDRGCFGGPT